MTQYIDKDALVAEIESCIRSLEACLNGKFPISASVYTVEKCKVKLEVYKNVMHIIDTLEVKEVDLGKEIQAFAKIELEPIKIYDANVGITITMHQLYKCAKHFFELGLKTQQNTNINITNIDKVIEENGVDPNSKEAKMFKESYYMALEKLKAKKGE